LLSEPWLVNSYTVNHKHKGGSFGMESTAEDYWRFAQMMLNGGELNGVRILSPQVVHYIARDHLGAIDSHMLKSIMDGVGFGLGFAVMKDPAATGLMSNEGTLFWGGAAETHFWIDPKADLVAVAMTQRMGVPDADVQELWAQCPDTHLGLQRAARGLSQVESDLPLVARLHETTIRMQQIVAVARSGSQADPCRKLSDVVK